MEVYAVGYARCSPVLEDFARSGAERGVKVASERNEAGGGGMHDEKNE